MTFGVRNPRSVDDYLRQRLQRAIDELNGIDPDAILDENSDVLVASLMSKHLPTKISID